MSRRLAALAGAVAVLLLAGCGDSESGGDDVDVTVSTTSAELVNYEMTTAQYSELAFDAQRKVLDSLLFQVDNVCDDEVPQTFYADVAARAFAAPRQTELEEVVLQLCDEGYGTLAG